MKYSLYDNWSDNRTARVTNRRACRVHAASLPCNRISTCLPLPFFLHLITTRSDIPYCPTDKIRCSQRERASPAGPRHPANWLTRRLWFEPILSIMWKTWCHPQNPTYMTNYIAVRGGLSHGHLVTRTKKFGEIRTCNFCPRYAMLTRVLAVIMCLCVCNTPVLYQNVKRRITQTMPRDSPATPVFGRQQSFVGGPHSPEICAESDPPNF